LRKPPSDFEGSQNAELENSAPASSASLSDEQVQELVNQRAEARKRRDWKESDRIRDELVNAGVVINDKPNEPTGWTRN
jgi:cysteinyl-tRNA synthetase